MSEPIPLFYSRPGLHVEIYDLQTADKWASLGDTAFYLEEVKTTGGPVLELGCGTGRVTIPMLDSGLEVHGLDFSAAMLEAAKRKRDALPDEAAKRLHLHLGDMTQFELGQKFAFIFIAFRSFQILVTPEAQLQCLACVRRHLAPGGKAIINLFDPRYEFMLPGLQESTAPPREFTHPISGNRVTVETLERVNDPVSQTLRERWRFTEFGAGGEKIRQEEELIRLRWSFRYEMRHLLERSGFAIEAEYSDFHRSPPAYAKEQVWVARAA
jgi:SAM-dependent methyltransferase